MYIRHWRSTLLTHISWTKTEFRVCTCISDSIHIQPWFISYALAVVIYPLNNLNQSVLVNKDPNRKSLTIFPGSQDRRWFHPTRFAMKICEFVEILPCVWRFLCKRWRNFVCTDVVGGPTIQSRVTRSRWVNHSFVDQTKKFKPSV